MSQERIQQINEEIVRLEAQKNEGTNDETTTRINAQIKSLEDERVGLEAVQQEAEQAEREQLIEDKVASIVLPYDFNDLYDNSTANETIIEIVQQFKRQDLVEHNAEVLQLKDEIRAANDREMQLQRQNRAMQSDLIEANEDCEHIKNENTSLLNSISELQNELQDVRQSRDNAALQIEEQKLEIERLNSHVDDLVKEQAVGAREAHKVIETNQTLNQLIEKANAEKQAKIKSAAELVLENGVPFRGKVELPSVPQQELPFPVAPQIEPDSNQLPSAEAPKTVAQEQQFPVIAAPAVQGASTPMVESPPIDVGTSGETPITERQLERRLAQHKAEIIAEIMEGKVA